MKFEIDWARGFAYKKSKGFIIKVDPKGLYIRVGLKKIFLTSENSIIMERVA